MSWDFDNGGSNTSERFRGTSTSTYSLPLSFGAYIKVANWISGDIWTSWDDAYSANDSIYLSTAGTEGYAVASRDASAGIDVAIYEASAGEYDGVWLPVIGIVTSNTLRDIYVGARANTAQDTASSIVGAAYDSMVIGTRADGGQLYQGLVAEVFFYDGVLSNADIDAYMAGTRPTSFAGAANLVGYYSLSTSDTTPDNESAGDGGALSLTGTGTSAFSADHPTMSDGGTSIPLIVHHRRMLGMQ